jgi:hypothetical protein
VQQPSQPLDGLLVLAVLLLLTSKLLVAVVVVAMPLAVALAQVVY